MRCSWLMIAEGFRTCFSTWSEGPAEVADLASAAGAENLDLLGREAEPPEDSLFPLAFEPRVELVEAAGVFEAAEIELSAGAGEMNGLGEGLDDLACPEALLGE